MGAARISFFAPNFQSPSDRRGRFSPAFLVAGKEAAEPLKNTGVLERIDGASGDLLDNDIIRSKRDHLQRDGGWGHRRLIQSGHPIRQSIRWLTCLRITERDRDFPP